MQPQLFDSTPYERNETGALLRPQSRPSRVTARLHERNSSPRDYEASDVASPSEAVGAEVAAEMRGRQPVVRADTGAATAVLRGGRFRTQFETQASNGDYDPEFRRETEHRKFGIPYNTPPAARPVYGYMQPPEGHENRHTEESAAGSYGNVEFHLNPDRIAHRSTVTFGDSLGSGHPAVPLQDAQMGRAIPENFPSRTYTGHPYQPDTYYELQVHGGVSTRDVASMEIGTRDYDIPNAYDKVQLKREARYNDIPYTEHAEAEVYQQGSMVRSGRFRGGFDRGDGSPTEHAIPEDFHGWDYNPDLGGSAIGRAYMPTTTSRPVQDRVTKERWHPGLDEPVRRTPYPVPRSGELRPRDRF